MARRGDGIYQSRQDVAPTSAPPVKVGWKSCSTFVWSLTLLRSTPLRPYDTPINKDAGGKGTQISNVNIENVALKRRPVTGR